MLFVCCIMLIQLSVMWHKVMWLIDEFECICEFIISWILLVDWMHVFMRTYLCLYLSAVQLNVVATGTLITAGLRLTNVSSRLMQVCTYGHTCMYPVCMHIYTYAHITHILLYTYIIYIHTVTYIHIRAHVCVLMYTYIHTYVSVCT